MTGRIGFIVPRVMAVALVWATCPSCLSLQGESSAPPGSGGANATGGQTDARGSGGAGGSTKTSSATGGQGSGGAATGGTSHAGGNKAGGASAGAGGAAGAGGSKVTASGGAGGAAGGSGGTTTTSGDPLIGDVTFSPPSQTFKDSIQVDMKTAISGAEIRYTIDGTLPTSTSTVYDGKALALSAATQIRAQAFAGGSASGAVSTGIYIARTIDHTSDIPIILIESYGKAKPCDKNTYVDVSVMIWEPVDGVAKMSSLPTLVARAGYHVRGQSSMALAQTPYKVELRDNANKDLDYPLLGMPADSDWALIAPYYDRTLIRNPFVYTLGKDMGMEAPRTAYAEVYVNQTKHAISDTEYEGVYWLTETIKNNKVRTNLKQLDADDTDASKLSGGYIFKFDQAAAEEPKLLCKGSNPVAGFGSGGGLGGGGFGAPAAPATKAVPASTTTCKMTYGGGGGTSTGQAGTCWTDLEVVDPEDLNEQQKAWITDYLQKFHDGLHKTPIGDYATYIDLKSFIDYLLVSELTRNVDAYVRSAYFFKDRDDKLKAGPLWDYNFALGGVGAQNATPTSSTDVGWQYTGTGRNVNNWYPKLTSDPSFMAQVKTRYTELRKSLWSDSAMKTRIETLSAPLKQAAVRDHTRWPVSGVILSSTGFTGGPTAPTWEGQLQVMRDFVLARLAWMDTNLK